MLDQRLGKIVAKHPALMKAQRRDLVEVVHTLNPVGCIKG